MSDDKKKGVLDDIDLSFDDDFDKEVSESFSEKTAMESSEDYEDAGLHIQDEKTMVQDSGELDIVEKKPEKPTTPPKPPVEKKQDAGSHDIDAFDDKSNEFGMGLESSLDLGDLIEDSEDIDIGGRTEAFSSKRPSESTELLGAKTEDVHAKGTANIQELFSDVSEDLSGGATDSIEDDFESKTELVDSEEVQIGGVSTSEKTNVGAKRAEPRKVEPSSKEQKVITETTKSKAKKSSRRRKLRFDRSTLLKIGGGMLMVSGVLGYFLFFTDSGILGISFKKPVAKSRLEHAADEAASLTPELLQELDQKYDRAAKLLDVDTYASYQKANVLYQEILDAFSNHPNASSGLASSTLLANRGYLDNTTFNDVQKWVRHAEAVSPNTKETLRAKIRFLMFQKKLDEALARVDQLLKLDSESVRTQLVAAEYYMQAQNYEEAKKYLDLVLAQNPDHIRAHYVLAKLELAQGNSEQGEEKLHALMNNNAHLASAVEYYANRYEKKDPSVFENLQKLMNESGNQMSPLHYSLGYKILSEIFDKEGKSEESTLALEKAVQKMTLNDQYAFELGEKYEKQKNYAKSVQYLNQAYQLDKSNNQYAIAYGRNLRWVGKSKEAEEILKPVIVNAPQLEDGIVQYAESRADQGLYEDVISFLLSSLEKDPKMARVKNLLGELYVEQNKFDQASVVFLQALKVAKTDYDRSIVNRSLGTLALKQEKWDSALGYLKKSNQEDPGNTYTLFALGKAYYYKSQYKEAESAIIDALNIDSTNSEARGVLAQIYFDKGKVEEAKKVINEVLEDDPKNVPLRVTLGKMLIEENQFAEAIDHLDEAYLYDSENYETYYYLGIAERELGKVDYALRSFSRAIEIWGDSHNAYYQRGLTFIRKNDISNANLDMKKAIELKPDWPLPIKAIAKYYFEVSLYDQSTEYYQKIVKVDPKDEEALFYLGKSYFFQEKPEKALEQFSKLIRLNPRHAKGYYEIGVIFEDAGDFPQAVTYLQKSQSLDPSNPDVYYHLGFVMKNLNKRKQAAGYFQKHLELNPKSIEKEALEDEIFRLNTYK